MAVPPKNSTHFLAAWHIPDIRFFLGCSGFASLAGRALIALIGFQIYQLTHSAAAIGLLGLIEAIPALTLVLFGGYTADHFNRQKILLLTLAFSTACAIALAILSAQSGPVVLIGLYSVVFLVGIARAFADPAATAFEAQVVSQELTVNAASWISSTWITCAALGPIIITFIFADWGAPAAYAGIAVFFALSWGCAACITPKPTPVPQQKEPLFKSISAGWRYVWNHPVLLPALSLDLFAVLFGGMLALLPIYAESILHIGAKGFGLLNAAPWLGTLAITLATTHKTPIGRAGRNLLIAVAGFGISVLVFAVSRNFAVSLAALFASGAFDGISVVIRRSMLRLLSPEEMRGRIAAANWVFITASNELGAFESGMVAAWIGVVPCVVAGGLMTLGVVAFNTVFSPKLRRLRFNTTTLESSF